MPGAKEHYQLAFNYTQSGQLDEAEQRFHESLEAAPNWPARYLNWLGLALLHHQTGQQGESQQCLDKAVELMELLSSRSWQGGRLEGQLLRREVEELLGKPAQGESASESEKAE